MSFWPFPTRLAAELEEAAGLGPVVELGSGRGDLLARLRDAGIHAWGLELGDEVDPRGRTVRADARRLPFADASVGGFVLGDLLRHLDPADRRSVADEVRRALRPGGRICVLEDTPVADDPAAENYREALRLLAQADRTRGAAAGLDELTVEFVERFGRAAFAGVTENEVAVRDPRAPLAFLALGALADRPAVEALAEKIDRYGMRYGPFAWCVFVRATGQEQTR